MTMITLEQNKTKALTVSKLSLYISLTMRTLFFVLFGLVMVGLLALMGEEQPLKAAEKWWPFQAIMANIASFIVLRRFMKQEGRSYRSFFALEKGRIGKDLKQFALLLIFGFVVGGLSLYLFSYLILGSVTPPELMFQPLPLWAAIIALVIFPLTNGLVETPTYIGYAMPRMKAVTGKLWIGVVLAGLALAFQHVALPLVMDVPYMLWRFAAFIPLAIMIGFIYNRTRRLLPIAAVHYVMDLQLAATLFIYSLN